MKIDSDVQALLREARETSWQRFGKRVTFYLPGMFKYGNEWGKYPAISITGRRCQLHCDHCQGLILEPMIPVETPQQLLAVCLKLYQKGNIGCLISGGSLRDGSLPWDGFIDVIRTIKKKTNLNISVHSGLIDFETARKLKRAGVDQALIDVIGSEDTLREVYHLNRGVKAIENSLKALKEARLALIPHVVVGLHYGQIGGEYRAIDIISKYNPATLVIVVLMALKNTPMDGVRPPGLNEIAKIFATARLRLPETQLALGCARPRGKYGSQIEEIAIEAGVNKIAIQSEQAIKRAEEYGLEKIFRKTCCSWDF